MAAMQQAVVARAPRCLTPSQQLMQDPAMMEQMLNSPMMDAMLGNPQFLQTMIDSNPALQQVIEQNPQFGHVLRDPELMRERFAPACPVPLHCVTPNSIRIARNPALRQQMERNMDRAMSNLEAMPGGFNALSQLHRQVQEPLLDALQQQQQQSPAPAPSQPSVAPSGPNTSALPNPWATCAAERVAPHPRAQAGCRTAGTAKPICIHVPAFRCLSCGNDWHGQAQQGSAWIRRG